MQMRFHIAPIIHPDSNAIWENYRGYVVIALIQKQMVEAVFEEIV